ncbi:zinc-dependent alcohol dehydrogenase [Halomicrococcus sp. SG-WS-1]|uniref:zinc-dependent alcohol dehydrogenase n=1 Tax=Halomicrococcus sp. SG-WS-1 TaxID=3439057 RepID=UPI003F794747
MTAVRALQFTGPREVTVCEREVPEPGPDEVRVRTEVSAVSPGTELLVYRGDAPEEMASDEAIDALTGDFQFPLQYGYAAVGRVTATGANVADDWTDERAFAFHPHQSHFLASPDDLHRVPKGLSTAEAAFLPNVETAVNFLLDGDPRVGEQAVVFGQGLVGLLTTALLADCPLADLLTLDRYPERRELAREMGADRALAPEDAPDGVRDALDADATPDGADLTFELSGNPAALDDAVAVTGYDGRVLVGSWYGEKRSDLDLGGRFHRSRIAIESTQVSTVAPELRGRWDKARRLSVAWRRLADLDVERLVTHRIPVAEADRAYRLLDDNPEDALGVLFTYD